MRALELLRALTAVGCQLVPDGERLRVQDPHRALTDDLRQAIRQHKLELLELLEQQEEAIERDERDAIYEYEGGMARGAAEALATHGHVVALPPCPRCNGMAYQYADGYVRCTTPWCQED